MCNDFHSLTPTLSTYVKIFFHRLILIMLHFSYFFYAFRVGGFYCTCNKTVR